jgi:hypothetical protein
MNEQVIITPKTKVLHLINAYPQLEDILIGYVPAFKKLKNPVLRKTVASIATLQQAATIGNVKVEDLINLLRKEVGQDLFTENVGNLYNSDKPTWFNEQWIVKELDAKLMLAVGEEPVAQVMADLKELENGKIYKLIAPFLPAPLIDKATNIGMQHWIIKENDNSFIVYFCKKS